MAFLQELEERTFDQLVTDFDGEIPGVHRDLGDVYFQEVAWELRRRDPERAARALLARLPRADPARVSAALLALSADGERDRKYVPTLRAQLDHPSPSIQSAAIDGLRVLGDVDSAPRIEPLAHSPDPAVRAAVLRFLAGTEHPDALRRLRAALADEDPYVRANAIDGLVPIAGARGRRWIAPLAEDPAEIVRRTVAEALKPDDSGSHPASSID
jgi:HEAT repeat protein